MKNLVSIRLTCSRAECCLQDCNARGPSPVNWRFLERVLLRLQIRRLIWAKNQRASRACSGWVLRYLGFAANCMALYPEDGSVHSHLCESLRCCRLSTAQNSVKYKVKQLSLRNRPWRPVHIFPVKYDHHLHIQMQVNPVTGCGGP
jgi:hypothetical protein